MVNIYIHLLLMDINVVSYQFIAVSGAATCPGEKMCSCLGGIY